MQPRRLIQIIAAADPALRDASLDAACRGATLAELLAAAAELDAFWRASDNLYERVRALLFLYAVHRFHLPRLAPPAPGRRIPYDGYRHLLSRRFEEAIGAFLRAQDREGPSDALSSALASAYHQLGFQTLASQVRRSVRSLCGNQWMFRVGHPADQPLRLRRELFERDAASGNFPILSEHTPVRMDLSHSAWSDIFFLGMDFPEGARVLNVSIDLAVRGRDRAPRPPVNAYLRVLDEPVLRLVSIDLGDHADVTSVAEVFDFARDYLGLLKAAVIASGIVPPGMEGSQQGLGDLFARMLGPGRGLEIASHVNDIPKGSRLAVSTSLLACLIAACMRATGQTESLCGPLAEGERRLVAARAILGEWLAGSGGGWQDSGGLWPGMKLIQGERAREGDAEFGVSRGRLLPSHRIFGAEDAAPETRRRLQESLVLVHGGMAQDVGPILEMVTEKYLLRCEEEWRGRQEAARVLDGILEALRRGDIRGIGELTTQNFRGPIQTIIPWANNHYTETLIARVRAQFGDGLWGFWMLGGMSGGGMGFIFAPEVKAAAQDALACIMTAAKHELQHALPFAMEPVVYDFAINEQGTSASLHQGSGALMPPGYYALLAPRWVKMDARELTPARRAELETFSAASRSQPAFGGMVEVLFDHLVPSAAAEEQDGRTLAGLLAQHGFDAEQHEAIRADLRGGRLGLAQNRLPASTEIADVGAADVEDAASGLGADYRRIGLEALAAGRVAVVTLAAGTGSRWTRGAGVVKALYPFCRLAGRHRSFLDVHLAKSRRIGKLCGTTLPHVVTTSYLTHDPIAQHLAAPGGQGYAGPLCLSPGRAVGLRLVPMVRDLRFAWEELPRQLLDEQKQKVLESQHAALIAWARKAGEGADYTENLPLQCLHPVGHWYEVPNLLRNGVLAGLLAERPQLSCLLLHNIDTVGADADFGLLGLHMASGAALTFEVITRRVEDLGGGLARVDGRVRLVEGLALPREEIEFDLSCYNTMTTWIDVDRLLAAFGLTRADLGDAERVAAAIRALAARLPTYVTLKDVKKRWGHGQEDVFPVCQYEKLWGDMTALREVDCRYVVVPRPRGQQLKDQAQLDGWLRDGSAAYLESLCDFGEE
ncbi:MAG: UTP--glucose-1-phosphate uridylyltransferase [Planctomycetes bacterium]|nr:UTP--glucose-1-phosphate uridylyltransferase [Planctomycetota bacterium]